MNTRNFYYLQVGATVVAAFTNQIDYMRCVRALAPGVGVTIKKGHKPDRPVPQLRTKGNAQQQTIFPRTTSLPAGTHQLIRPSIRYMKPGEFRL